MLCQVLLITFIVANKSNDENVKYLGILALYLWRQYFNPWQMPSLLSFVHLCVYAFIYCF
jgi:hypothetical protein